MTKEQIAREAYDKIMQTHENGPAIILAAIEDGFTLGYANGAQEQHKEDMLAAQPKRSEPTLGGMCADDMPFDEARAKKSLDAIGAASSEHEHDYCLAGGRCRECGLTVSQVAEVAESSETQEWTVRFIGSGYMVFAKGGSDVVDFAWINDKYPKQLADAHNAALAAAKIARDNERVENLELKRQLVSEREKADRAMKEVTHLVKLNEQRYGQLLAAQAAIEKHNKEVLEDDGLGQLRHLRVIDTDLSDLEQHDKEKDTSIELWKETATKLDKKLKPLVEALEKVVELYPHLTNLKDLLASVKEGK